VGRDFSGSTRIILRLMCYYLTVRTRDGLASIPPLVLSVLIKRFYVLLRSREQIVD
jgi:hypothetical protein